MSAYQVISFLACQQAPRLGNLAVNYSCIGRHTSDCLQPALPLSSRPRLESPFSLGRLKGKLVVAVGSASAGRLRAHVEVRSRTSHIAGSAGANGAAAAAAAAAAHGSSHCPAASPAPADDDDLHFLQINLSLLQEAALPGPTGRRPDAGWAPAAVARGACG